MPSTIYYQMRICTYSHHSDALVAHPGKIDPGMVWEIFEQTNQTN